MSDMTVASTTDTQEELNRVAGITPEVKEEVPPPEPKPEVAEPEPAEPERKAKSAFQKRIDKLTREKYEAAAERDAAKAEIEALKAKLGQVGTATQAETQVVAPEKVAEKPTPDKFATYEEYVEALADWKAEQKLQETFAKAEEEAAKEAEQERTKAIFTEYNRQVVEAKRQHDDFEEVVGQEDIQIPQAVQVAVMQMENGAEVAYYLGKHPEFCEKLVELSAAGKDALAIARVGAIGQSLEPVQTEELEREETATSAPRADARARVASRAPAPVKPVSGNTTKSSVPLDELDYPAYRRIRDQQERDRYRR